VALELVVLWAGRHRRDRFDELCADYRQRVSRWLPIRETAVRARTGAADAGRLGAEGEALRSALPPGAWTVALDREGEALSSLELARQVETWLGGWPHPVAFLLGSDLGLASTLAAKCRQRISFGPMTLSHEIARLVLYEQLYRALSIVKGIGYHR